MGSCKCLLNGPAPVRCRCQRDGFRLPDKILALINDIKNGRPMLSRNLVII